MELYLFHHDTFQLRYNCSFFSVEQVPLEARQHLALGWGLIALFFIFEAIYVPCLVVLWRLRNESSCYKFMLYIGVVDVVLLLSNALFTGILTIQGAMYCTYPTLMLYTGLWGLALWVAESTATVCLALNRCVAITSPYWNSVLYDEHRAWLWLLIPTSYAALTFFYSKPVVFSGILVAWFFNPYIGYFDDIDGVYHSIMHTAHNAVIALALPGIYIVFSLLLLKKSRAAGGIQQQTATVQKAAFGQAAVISVGNAFIAGSYVFMQFFPVGVTVIYSASYMWVIMTASPAMVYLVLNRTVRKELVRMCRGGAQVAPTTLLTTQQKPQSSIKRAIHVSTQGGAAAGAV